MAWASLAQRFPASSVLAREGAGCGSVFPLGLTALLSLSPRDSQESSLAPQFENTGRGILAFQMFLQRAVLCAMRLPSPLLCMAQAC